MYRTAKPGDKKALLAAFRQVSQELGEKKRKDTEKEQERRKSIWHGDGALSGPAPPVPDLLSPGRPLSAIGISVTDSKDLRWIDEFGDDLTMAIATRDWEESVKQVEKGQHGSESRRLKLIATFRSRPSEDRLFDSVREESSQRSARPVKTKPHRTDVARPLVS